MAVAISILFFLSTDSFGIPKKQTKKLFSGKGSLINTQDNNAGITDDMSCYVFDVEQPDGSMKKQIVCYKGKRKKMSKTFKNIGYAESSLTGTPGHLMYKNYIGSLITKKSTPGLMGSGKKLNFCDGECKGKK